MGLSANSNYVPGRPPLVTLMVHRHMVDKALNSARKFDVFHPSAWGSCLRKISYQYYNEKSNLVVRSAESVDDRIERVFDNGHYAHFRWQNYLTNSKIMRGYWRCARCGVVYGKENRLGIFSPIQQDASWCCKCDGNEVSYQEIEVQSPPEYNFKGNVDAVIDLRGSEWEQGNEFDVIVIDFKTMKDEYFSDLREAKHEHVIQVHIYMWLLDCQIAIVLYENKDNQSIKEMVVPRNEKIIDKIKEESLWLVDVIRHKKLPDRPSEFSQHKFPCRMCEFRKICYR